MDRLAAPSRPRPRFCRIPCLHLAHVFRFCARSLSAILDLARAFHSCFIAHAVHRGPYLELGFLVRFLQNHLWRFALVGRDFDRRSKRALGALVAFAMVCSRPRIYYTLEQTQNARGVSVPSASKRLP